jgi:hypothetical protein
LADLWPWAPLLPFVETLSFKTDVQLALEAESRTSVRLGRMVYQMQHIFDNAANLEAEGVFDERRLTTFRVPAWGEATEFAGGLPAGVTVIPVADADWRIGGQAFLSGPGRQSEVIAITAVGSGSITLAAPTTRAARFAAPVRTCKALTPLTGTRVFDGLSERRVNFVTQDNIAIGAHDMPTVDGLIVVDDAPVSAQGTEQAMVHPVQTVDDGPGGIEVLPVRSGVDHRLSFSFTDRGAAAVWRRRRFWHVLAGRATEFWLPSFVRDLTLRQGIGAADLTVRLVAPGWAPSLLIGRVLTLDDSGVRVHRKVTGITVDGADWVAAITGSTGRSMAPASRVSIARRMRLDQDDIRLTHIMPAMRQMVSGAVAVGVP